MKKFYSLIVCVLFCAIIAPLSSCKEKDSYYEVVYESYNVYAMIFIDDVMVDCVEYNDKDEVVARNFIADAKTPSVFKANPNATKLRFKMTAKGSFIDGGHQTNEIKNVFYLEKGDTTRIKLDPEKLEQEKIED